MENNGIFLFSDCMYSKMESNLNYQAMKGENHVFSQN